MVVLLFFISVLNLFLFVYVSFSRLNLVSPAAELYSITTKRSTGYFLRSSSAPQLTVPRVKTEFAMRAFRVAAPQIWNVLPVSAQSSQSVHVFKSRLKTFLFNRASI